MTVQVRLAGRLGPGQQRVGLEAGATVADLVATVAAGLGLEAEQLRGIAVAVGGEVVPHDRPLHDGEALSLVLPVAGGA